MSKCRGSFFQLIILCGSYTDKFQNLKVLHLQSGVHPTANHNNHYIFVCLFASKHSHRMNMLAIIHYTVKNPKCLRLLSLLFTVDSVDPHTKQLGFS